MPDYIIDTKLEQQAIREAIDETAALHSYGVKWRQPNHVVLDSNTRLGFAVSTLDPVPIFSVVISTSPDGTEVGIYLLSGHRGGRSHFNQLRRLTAFVRALARRMPGSHARSGMGAPGYYMPPMIH